MPLCCLQTKRIKQGLHQFMVKDYLFSPSRATLDKAIAAAAGRPVRSLQKDTAAYASYCYKVGLCNLLHPEKTAAHTVAGLSILSDARLDAHARDVRSEINKIMKRAVQLAYPGLAVPMEARSLADRQAADKALKGEPLPPSLASPCRVTPTTVSCHGLEVCQSAYSLLPTPLQR